MTRTRRAALAAALVAAVSLPLAAAGAASAEPRTDASSPTAAATGATALDVRSNQNIRLELPRLSGPYAVGRDTIHLTDRSRPDPWVSEAKARELMVDLYFPARPGTGRAAPYMSTEEARLLLESRDLDKVVPPETVSATATQVRTAARPTHGRFPLVVLSPGFGMNRATLTHLAGDLASRGYVVAAVDHAYESLGTRFPGGRVLTCVACAKADEGGDAVRARVPRVRAADVSFLLDRLTGRHPAWRHAGLIDRQRIGMAGHSIGGAGAAETMATDRRVRAGVNMDGAFVAPVPEDGLDGRPFMMLGTDDEWHRPGGKDRTWDEAWTRFDGWKRWLTVAGSGHMTFTDLPILGEQLGLPDPEVPLSGRRSAEITHDYVAAFFDLHLRGEPQPLLEGPSRANPEVRFQNP
ncbi:alpha/beta hydrolase [Streptomyces sp. XD-27]|uniref:alpha/beta hydrolase family protein n=1 Tax=Streptomyces sp. XD-27 TaxID=3062779 RepID=UPI0026F43D59|nr:alpha/beta hydrolase [Streptomyces sp. XD-27]WKX71120.1 alpha/beta hydrolase [Streptomyces sp. XD-27]